MMISCDYCGTKFDRKPSQIIKYNHHFCSRKCNDEFRKAQIEKFCQYCGGKIKRQPNGKRTGNEKYCSIRCQGLASRKRVKFECEICGEVCEIPQCHFNRYEHHTCSKECAIILHSKIMTGEGNSNYKGSHIVRDDSIRKRLMRAARKRDNDTCQLCRSRSNLEVHHIIPFVLVGEKGGLSNLTTLCHKCHKEVHKTLRESEDLYEELFNLNGTSHASQISTEGFSLSGPVRSYDSRNRRREDILSPDLVVK